MITKATVTKDKETGEYVVKVWVDGKRREEADYFTNDKQDAQQTAATMLKNKERTMCKVTCIMCGNVIELDEPDQTVCSMECGTAANAEIKATMEAEYDEYMKAIQVEVEFEIRYELSK